MRSLYGFVCVAVVCLTTVGVSSASAWWPFAEEAPTCGGACSFFSPCQTTGCFCDTQTSTCMANTACGGTQCSGAGSCGESCYCGSDPGGVCVESNKCSGTRCTSPGSCGSQCFCSSYGTCYSPSDCNGVRCSQPGACGTECFCSNSVCRSNSNCAGVKCSEGGWGCGSQCQCDTATGMCKQIPQGCNGQACTSTSECQSISGNSKCQCIDRVCTVPTPQLTFAGVLATTLSTMTTSIETEVKELVTGDLSVTVEAFTPTSASKVDINNCGNEPAQPILKALEDLMSSMIQTLTGAAGGADTSSVEIADSMQTHASETLGTPLQTLSSPAIGVSGGGGLGWGFNLQCGTTGVWGWGGGGGAGSQGTLPPGGGGGAGGGSALTTNIEIGGGFNCAFANGIPSCTSSPDNQSYPLSGSAYEIVTLCRQHGTPAVLCLQGGGGMGATVSQCQYDGGFSYTAATYVTLSSDGDASSPPTLRLRQTKPGEQAPEIQCAQSNGATLAGNIARGCTSQCTAKPSVPFYSCYCPCFKQGLLKAQIPWAATVNCTTGP